MASDRRPRVALFSELPTPYRWPVFRRLLLRPELDLRIFFCARTESDRDWAFDFDPDERVRFLPGFTVSLRGRRTFHYHVNPTVFGLLRRERFDVVVLPGYSMFASHFGALWCRATGTPYVIFSETTHLDRRRAAVRAVKRLILPVLVGGASAWLATGTRSREYLESYGARGEDVHRFPNTPDVSAFAERARAARGGREMVRRRRNAPGGVPVVLFVARLIGVKRCDLLVRAMGLLGRRGIEARGWIAGDGPERERLEALASEQCPDGITFLGNVPTAELPAIYAAADLFVLPSDHEPWGAVVCEAMACGLPVVLSDRVGSAVDLVAEGENGATFPAGDAGALAAALGRLLSDPGALRTMGRNSLDRILRWTHRQCEESFLSAIGSALRRGGRGCLATGS